MVCLKVDVSSEAINHGAICVICIFPLEAGTGGLASSWGAQKINFLMVIFPIRVGLPSITKMQGSHVLIG